MDFVIDCKNGATVVSRSRFSIDAVGNVVAESGAVYPIRRAYDTEGRCTLLATTRDGTTWDETRWAYDAATGLCKSKIYADGSQVTYTYTPDGLLSRTTYASGRWIENVYDSQRQVVGRISGDGSDNAALGRDEFGWPIASSNAAASIVLELSDIGLTTNETWAVGDSSLVLARGYDEQSRLARLAIMGADYEQDLGYAEDGRLVSVSNGDAVVTYLYASDRHDAGYTIRLPNGNCFARTVERDAYRRELVTNISNALNGVTVDALAYSHDALNRPFSRNSDSFSYNVRGEVSSAQIAGFVESHVYDDIGNSTFAATASATNDYSVNCLNQYTTILCGSAALREAVTPTYDSDGNLTALSPFSYAYDSASRLVSVSSNDTLLATYAYDAQGRRVRKTTLGATTTFCYDDWNLIEERIAYSNGTFSTIHYYWGTDLSGSLQGAGGIGGLLYLKINEAIYIPIYDANGNITKYLDANGNVVASYTYDAFGNLLQQSGSLADTFAFRFSTKYHDSESGLHYYGKRFYSPTLRRWLTRDPIEEQGGANLYAFCENNAVSNVDPLGNNRYMTTFRLDPRKDQWHVGVAVDTWQCKDGEWTKTGIVTFEYLVDDSSWWKRAGRFVLVAKGVITETAGLTLNNPFEMSSTPQQDRAMLELMRRDQASPPLYNLFFNNCIHWATKAIDYGMDQ